MANTRSVRLNQGEINRLLHGASYRGGVHQYVRRLGNDVEREAKRLVPFRTGNLRRSINVTRIVDTSGTVQISVTANAFRGSFNYGLAQEFGTGIHGFRGTPIRARRGKVFAFQAFASDIRGPRNRSGQFQVQSAGTNVVVSKHNGTPKTEFLRNALRIAAAKDPSLRVVFIVP